MASPLARWSAVVVGGALAIVVAGSAIAQQPPPVGDPLITSLSGPRGLHALPGGDALVADAGAGRSLRVKPDGSFIEVMTGLPVSQSVSTDPLASRGVAAAVSDSFGGYRYIIAGSDEEGFASVYRADAGGAVTLLADLGAFEQLKNSDGDTNAQGVPEIGSNPYDIVLDGSGGVYVSDRSADAVIRVDVYGIVRAFAIFEDIPNPAYPLTGPAEIDQMPTGMTTGPDGALYVTTFTGFPYPVGEGRVYRLKDTNADGDALDPGESTVVATGLTAPTDVAFDLKGAMLVSEYSTNVSKGALGRISKIVDGLPTPFVHLLNKPTSIVVTETGRLLVTEESIGRVSDVTDASSGGFSAPIAPGLTLTSYAGGSVAQLSAEASELGVQSIAVSANGKLIVFVVGAPSFVNSSFNARFAAGVPGGTLMLVVSS